MIKTLNTSQVTNELLKDEYAGWSYKGAHAIAEMLEQYEDDTGENIELDIVAIRCEYSEYSNALECAQNHFAFEGMEYDDDGNEVDTPEEVEAKALEFLQNHTTVYEFDGGIIVQDF